MALPASCLSAVTAAASSRPCDGAIARSTAFTWAVPAGYKCSSGLSTRIAVQTTRATWWPRLPALYRCRDVRRSSWRTITAIASRASVRRISSEDWTRSDPTSSRCTARTTTPSLTAPARRRTASRSPSPRRRLRRLYRRRQHFKTPSPAKNPPPPDIRLLPPCAATTAAKSLSYRDQMPLSIATSSVRHRRHHLTKSTGALCRPERIPAWHPPDRRDKTLASSNSSIAWHRLSPWKINRPPEDRNSRRDTLNRPAHRRRRWDSEASTVVSQSPLCLVWRRTRILR